MPIFIILSIALLSVSDNQLGVDGDLNAGFPLRYLYQNGGFECAPTGCDPVYQIHYLIINLALYLVTSVILAAIALQSYSRIKK